MEVLRSAWRRGARRREHTGPGHGTGLFGTAGVISAAVAAAATWEGVANFGQIWLEKRRAAELLKVEGWLFLQRADKYRRVQPQVAFSAFATEVERQIAKEVGEYVAGFDVEAATARVSQTFKMLDAARVNRSQIGASHRVLPMGVAQKGRDDFPLESVISAVTVRVPRAHRGRGTRRIALAAVTREPLPPSARIAV